VRRLVLSLIAACALVGCGSFTLVAPEPPPQLADNFSRSGLRVVAPAELGPGTITPEAAAAAAGPPGPAQEGEAALPLLGVYAAWKELGGSVVPRQAGEGAGPDDPVVGVAAIEEVPVWVIVYGWSSGNVFEIALVDARTGRLVVDVPPIRP
jgi:hypothetical protein